MRKFKLVFIAAGLWASCQASALAQSATDAVVGDCRSFKFYPYFGDKLSDRQGQTVFVLRDKAPAYADAGSTTPDRTLSFSTGVNVIEIQSESEGASERVKVRFVYGDDQPDLWMQRSDLLCRWSPLIDDQTGLERKALIRTQTAVREDGVVQAIRASRTPEVQSTDEIKDRLLSRFTTYLIMAETANAYLLGDKFNLSTAQDKLVGWVKKEEVLNWNWSIGLRPPIDMKNEDGSYGTICGYESPDDRSNCIPILAGNSWFRSDLRLPVLEVGDTYYRVAAAASGLGKGEVRDGKLVITKEMLAQLQINPSESKGGIKESQLAEFNNIDVFFLIDGTKSMGPFIDTIRGDGVSPGVVQQIVDALERRGGGVSIRAGFRVFRDSTSDGASSGVDEGSALSDSNCDETNSEGREEDRRRFESRLARVKTTNEESDDYNENILGGLEQVEIDMFGCPNRQKLLFVIGDAGYDAEMQASRGQEPLSAAGVADRLLKLEKLTVFFLRPPLRAQTEFRSAKSYESYVDSWNGYADVGRALLDRVYDRYRTIPANSGDADAAEVNPNEYFIDLGSEGRATGEMLDRIVQNVKAVARPDVINEILVDLRGGAALEEVITKLRRENFDVPVLYWNMLRQTSCQDNEEDCSKRIYDGVFDLYVPKDQPAVLDAWMRSDQLSDWRGILDPIINIGEYNLPEQRQALGQAVRNSLSTILKLPAPENLNETIETYMRRSGLIPGPIRTPLLGYTFRQLEDPSLLPTCEIDRLRVWLLASRTMLRNAELQKLSTYNEETPLDCPNLTENGARLKFIREQPVQLSPGDDPEVYKLGRNYLGENIYWVPQEYLP